MCVCVCVWVYLSLFVCGVKVRVCVGVCTQLCACMLINECKLPKHVHFIQVKNFSQADSDYGARIAELLKKYKEVQ